MEKHFLDGLAGKEFGFQDGQLQFKFTAEARDSSSKALVWAKDEVADAVGQGNLSKISFGTPQLVERTSQDSYWSVSLNGPDELIEKVKRSQE